MHPAGILKKNKLIHFTDISEDGTTKREEFSLWAGVTGLLKYANHE